MAKNIVAFDIETTGLDRKNDHIIQIGMVKFNPDTFEIIDTYKTYIRPEGKYTIGIGAYFKHGITPKMLENAPTLKEIANELDVFFGDCDILTYNGNNFDIPFIDAEMKKVGHDLHFMDRECYDSFIVEKERHGNSLDQTFERYAGKTMNECELIAHDALSDVKATIEIYKAQSNECPIIPEKMYGLSGLVKDKVFQDSLQPCFAFGKYKDIGVQLISEIDNNYIRWAVYKSEFDETTKKYLTKYIK